MKKSFIEFLKLNGVYEAYNENAWSHHHARFEDKDREGKPDGISERNPPELWVKAAFSWIDSPEGHDYWQRIHNLWIHSLKTM